MSDQGLGNLLWHCVNDKANITTVFTPGIIIGLCFISLILAVVQLHHMWVRSGQHSRSTDLQITLRGEGYNNNHILICDNMDNKRGHR